MSDAKDAVAEAFVRMRRHAASLLVRKEQLEAELAEVERDYRAAMKELQELQNLARTADAVEQRAAVEESSSLGDDEQNALDNVRGHLADLEARVKVNQELAGAQPEDDPPPEGGDGSPTPRKKTM